MGARKSGALAATILGLVFLALAATYWTLPASSLPDFFFGYEPNSSEHHIKHGLAAFAASFFCFMLAWFQSGPKHRT